MLYLTGGDSTALAEIAAVADTFAALDPPDLAAAGRLEVQYEILSRRNADIPEWLPSVWARVGHVERAENLAESTTDLPVRVAALVRTAEQVRGDGGRARRLVRRALAVARSIREPDLWARNPSDQRLHRPGEGLGVLQLAGLTARTPTWWQGCQWRRHPGNLTGWTVT